LDENKEPILAMSVGLFKEKKENSEFDYLDWI
jgi:hypothetical protein